MMKYFISLLLASSSWACGWSWCDYYDTYICGSFTEGTCGTSVKGHYELGTLYDPLGNPYCAAVWGVAT